MDLVEMWLVGVAFYFNSSVRGVCDRARALTASLSSVLYLKEAV